MGRGLRALAVFVPAVVGTVFGLLTYISLTEGPYAIPGRGFEKPGFDAADCYHSAEAHFVRGTLDWLLLIVPVALVALTLLGAIAASLYPARRSDRILEPTPAVLDGMMAAGCSFFLAVGAAAAAHGYSIGRWLDAGCVTQPVPRLTTALGIVVVVVIGAIVGGFILERSSQQRRYRRPARHDGDEQPTLVRSSRGIS